jgi:hypothetical protein
MVECFAIWDDRRPCDANRAQRLLLTSTWRFWASAPKVLEQQPQEIWMSDWLATSRLEMAARLEELIVKDELRLTVLAQSINRPRRPGSDGSMQRERMGTIEAGLRVMIASRQQLYGVPRRPYNHIGQDLGT